MPNTTITPAQLNWSGQEITIEPVRMDISAASLDWTGGFILAAPGAGTNLSVTVPELDRLQPLDQLVNAQGNPALRLMAIWQQTMEQIETAFRALSTQVADNSALLAEIQAALALASAANDNATTANETISIANSYVSPGSPVTASNDGTVTIAAHTRFYGDKTNVAVNAGALSGFTSGDYVTVFYKDAAREGGAVTYQGTLNAVAQKGSTHVVGQVTVPQAGEPPSEGTGTSGSGYRPPPIDTLNFEQEYIDP